MYITKNEKIYIIFYIILSISFVFLLNYLQINIPDVCFSVFYILVQIISIIITWKVSNRKLGVFILFQMTFALFIGGRFVSCLLGSAENVFEPTFFYGYVVSASRKMEIFSYVLFFLVFATLGYAICRRNVNVRPWINLNIPHKMKIWLLKLANILFPLFCVYILFNSIRSYQIASSGIGYLSLYMDQSEGYSGGSKMISNMIFLFLAITLVYGDRTAKAKYLLLYILNAIILLMIGTRGAMGCMLIFLIWLYSLYNNINLKRLFLFSVASMICLLWLFSFSLRATDFEYVSLENMKEAIASFFYDNGVSLMVFDASRLLDDYPFIGYIQTFIPGVTFIYTLLTGNSSPEDILFTTHLISELNPQMYLSGFGLGWSILSDVYLYSFGGILILYCIISMVIGMLAALVENFSERYELYKILYIYIFTSCLLLPRGMMASPLNTFVYGIFFLFLFRLILIRQQR